MHSMYGAPPTNNPPAAPPPAPAAPPPQLLTGVMAPGRQLNLAQPRQQQAAADHELCRRVAAAAAPADVLALVPLAAASQSPLPAAQAVKRLGELRAGGAAVEAASLGAVNELLDACRARAPSFGPRETADVSVALAQASSGGSWAVDWGRGERREGGDAR
jgi:hypothetical protein